MTLGDWIAEAIIAHARREGAEVSAAADEVSAAQVPAIPLPAELTDTLSAIQARLEKLEADRRKPLIQRVFGRR
jgi:hypothetical protein